MLATLSRYEHLSRIISRVRTLWPEHAAFLALRFDGEGAAELDAAEELARRVWTLIADDIESVVTSYRWMCGQLLEEELYFRRHGRYRHTSVLEVERAGVFDDPYMTHYQNGLLLSQVLWLNHARVSETYLRDFLGGCDGRERLLEVGPGHGLFLALAADRLAGELTGWDISESCLRHTRRNLARLGLRTATLARHDIRSAPRAATFDLVVASEVLEHVEDPASVLASLRGLLTEHGRIFLNVPVNSPAPDHIHLWRSPEEFFGFVRAGGIRPLRTYTFPMTGYTDERARRGNFTISCVVVGERAPID
jgi:2-polyprenyl-3-methyl-5-hydroxy-6-metoxy-1,4-benzoquinol methylase